MRKWVGIMKLGDLKIDETGVIKKVDASLDIKRRLMDIGFIKGVKVAAILKSKSMTAFKIKGTVIAVRNDDIKDIEVEKCELV